MLGKTALTQKIRENTAISFRCFIAACYTIGALLHLLDVFDLRLEFSQMHPYRQLWIVYLLLADTVTVFFLFRKAMWGLLGFHVVAISQLIAYWGYQEYFGRQDFLVVFHILTLAAYWKIRASQKRREYNDTKRHIK